MDQFKHVILLEKINIYTVNIFHFYHITSLNIYV